MSDIQVKYSPRWGEVPVDVFDAAAKTSRHRGQQSGKDKITDAQAHVAGSVLKMKQVVDELRL